MDINTSNHTASTVSDDQELAKVLAGINDDNKPTEDSTDNSLLPPPPTPMPSEPQVVDPASDDAAQPTDDVSVAPTPTPPAPGSTGDATLDNIKLQALGELRPLVDKLNISPEEKFDTYLLLLRSTDDRDLIGPAHETAKTIVDETRRAQALLDIIKEIDFLSQPQS